MADLKTGIQNLSDEYLRRLGEIHDDYVHTRMLWNELLVRVRRHKMKLSVENPITKTVLDGSDLAGKSRSSVQRLMERSFKDIVAQLELFVAELLRLWLTANTTLISEKALNVATLLASKTLAEAQSAALEEAIESSISDKMYGRPDRWLNYLKKNVGARFAALDESSFIEMKARRDILEHNNGVAEATYRDKAKAAAKYQLGQQVEIANQDVDEAYHLVQRLIRELTASAIATLGAR
jgi:hypothetical protein